MAKTVLGVVALSVGVASAALAQVPAGGEFRINSVTTGFQGLPAVATNPNGGFVVAWISQFGSSRGVAARRFDAAGAPQGPDFRVDVDPSYAYSTEVAVDAKGRFMVVWRDRIADGSVDGILGRRFSAAGTALGGEFLVNGFTTGYQGSPGVAAQPGGGFVVTWFSFGGGEDIHVRRFDAAGTPLGAEFKANSYTTGVQAAPSIASAPDGRFVIAWTGDFVDGELRNVYGRRFDAAGTPVGADFRINANHTGDQIVPRVAMAADGSFAVAWAEFDAGRFVARRFDASGAPVGFEHVLPSVFLASSSSVGSDLAGTFTVAYENYDSSNFGVAARRFSPASLPMGVEFQVNTTTPGDQRVPDVASDRNGNLVVAWSDLAQGDTFARRYGGLFPAGLVVADGGNGVLEVADSFTLNTSWRNLNGQTQAFQGHSSSTVVPPGLTLTLSTDANYGFVPNGAVSTCSGLCFSGGLTGTRPAGHVDLSFLESIAPEAQGQTQRWLLHVGDTFSDVPRSSPYYRSIETLVHHGITGGCGGTNYCPLSSTSREQMAVFVLVAKEGVGYVPPACTTPVFNDVPASSPYCRWIEELFRRGVVGGCGAGNFCPAASVSREQMPIFVLKTLEPALEPPACTTPVFNDVPAASPYCRWIEELVRRGVVGGCGGGSYCPTAAVTREQMGVFIGGTFGLTLYGP
jgi:hypothetical protein